MKKSSYRSCKYTSLRFALFISFCVLFVPWIGLSNSWHQLKLHDYNRLILEQTDASFGGFYLNIDRAMHELSISRLQAHEIQNQMRDFLEERSGSALQEIQRPFLRESLLRAIELVIYHKKNENGFEQINFKKEEFILVLDWDETLLNQWYKAGKADVSQRVATFATRTRDQFFLRSSDGGLEVASSPNAVIIRPGVARFLESVAALRGFRGFVFFTAKEDRAAHDIYHIWKKAQPQVFRHVKGFFTRNHLRLDFELKKAGKDLRIFDSSLLHVFVIDDNENRIMQPDLNYQIPKFNADKFIDSMAGKIGTIDESRFIGIMNFEIFDHLAYQMKVCVKDFQESQIAHPTLCFEERLGKLSNSPDGELRAYFDSLRARGKIPPSLHRLNVEQIIQEKVFSEPEGTIVELRKIR